MSDCLFCKMARGEIAPDLVHQDAHLIAFRDIHPQAPLHALVVPREHIATLNDLEPAHAELVGRMYLTAARIAEAEGYAQRGYRTVMNCNRDAGQSVWHIHLHVLAGRPLAWPPG
jgi:histidine triad (HIT) family protein